MSNTDIVASMDLILDDRQLLIAADGTIENEGYFYFVKLMDDYIYISEDEDTWYRFDKNSEEFKSYYFLLSSMNVNTVMTPLLFTLANDKSKVSISFDDNLYIVEYNISDRPYKYYYSDQYQLIGYYSKLKDYFMEFSDYNQVEDITPPSNFIE